MPELPEVETVVRTLGPKLRGRRLERVTLLRTDILTPANADLPVLLRGQMVQQVDRRGKKILIRLQRGETLGVHLGMTGQLTVEPAESELKPHTHLLIELSDHGGQLRFRDTRRFGGLWWLKAEEAVDTGLGPEPLQIRAKQLSQRLARTRRAIKTALLDQAMLAGIGNIYADEALFVARIAPVIPSNQLSMVQVRRLTRAIKSVLKQAIENRGSSLRDYVDANGSSGRYQNLHRVYGREGMPCRKCKTTIERIVQGGRSTHFCPRCQRPDSGSGVRRK